MADLLFGAKIMLTTGVNTTGLFFLMLFFRELQDLVKEYTKERDDLLCKMLGLPSV